MKTNVMRSMTMTTTFRILMMAGLLVSAALPAAAQSANRTSPNVPATQAKVTAAPESDSVHRCRVHCQTQSASAARMATPQQSTAERSAAQSHCAKRMS
jgi:hypothetical protein